MNAEAKLTEDTVEPIAANHYRRIFGEASPTTYSIDELNKLAASMTNASNPFYESAIPSGYTYFGQFLNHEISKLERQENGDNLSTLRNLHSPTIDLETLYGGGPADHPQLYENDGIRLRLSLTSENVNPTAFDIPRENSSARSVVYDIRNDENLALSQTHVLLIKFHNALVGYLQKNGITTFAAVRREVVLHFQAIVLFDYLKRLVDSNIYLRLLKGERRIFSLPNVQKFVPAEFSMAAFRFGHSMIRDSYDWNRVAPVNTSVGELFELTGQQKFTRCNTGALRTLPTKWAIDWRRFFEVDNEVPVNRARMIGPVLSPALGVIRKSTECSQSPFTFSLAEADFQIGHRHLLLDGQQVAARIGLPPRRLASLPEMFAETTPLFHYVLEEAFAESGGNRLGPVGSLIVGETLFELIANSDVSILRTESWKSVTGEAGFSMPDLLRFIVDQEGIGWTAVNPNG